MTKDEITPGEEQEQQDLEVLEEEAKETTEAETDNKDEDYRSKLNAQNRFLEKEGYEFKDGKWVKPEAKPKAKPESKSSSEEGLSQKDVIYLAKASINDDDIDEVTNYASKMGVSVKEAHEFLKPVLQVRNEERKTAEATNTSKQTRGTGKVSPESILDKARKGQISEDDKDIEALVEAEMALSPKFGKER